MNVRVKRASEELGISLDMSDAEKLAGDIISGAEKCNFYANKLSVPGERFLNLALCFLQAKTPFMCCGQKPGKYPWETDERCKDCPMRQHDKVNHWTDPVRLPEKPAPRPKHPIHPKRHIAGRKGVAIKVGHLRFSSMTAAAKEMGVHRAVINRMLRDGEAQRDEPSQ